MNYPLENLDPERFQQLCQALIAREFPDMQAFPVAQPDGGRDAVAFLRTRQENGFVVFQVKFRRGDSDVEPHKWLEDIASKEAPKIKQQIPRGARSYILVTNLAGTAHPDVGTIDSFNKLLTAKLGLPANCWWRDDLSRRLDNAWDLKWVYPEIMTGPDLIRSIIEQGLSEDRERRVGAIRGLLTDQYSIDEEVKFKQVELQNKLLELFIDVPAVAPDKAADRDRGRYLELLQRKVAFELTSDPHTTRTRTEDSSFEEGDIIYAHAAERTAVGAASLLLHPLIQAEVPRLVLEGAPGQGKSTISQYVSQVHRMRVLGKADALLDLPEHHRKGPTRIPIKVDLRDLAVWLGRRDPFHVDTAEDPPAQWEKSLESFLAALIRHHAGGVEFSVADLLAVAKFSALLLVFDGLDEVADITRRQEVVDEIARGVKRLEATASSLQVLVTSRPAAFANSPGLPDDYFPYYELESVTRPLIDEYAEKWLTARRLREREATEVKKILSEKLDQPHMRDLARNPMQLAILLSLIHTRGTSLPDKRTSLYDNYVELFFNREAEKSAIVRDHRELLINIHRYLAWVLHTAAEDGNDSGSISSDKLHSLLAQYLATEGHDPNLAKALFAGMVERVVALVSRVEGTFEFEVQPLREYFAARFLFETAPYSPPGAEQRGTRPDRFDAIARDFYWFNVTRFYAGCYSKGELASLIDRLSELCNDEGYKRISHPRLLASTLLSDWVFSQHPRSVKEVVKLIIDGIGLRFVLTSSSRRVGSALPLVLPEKCGRDELVSRCFEMLKSGPTKDYAIDIIDVLRANASSDRLNAMWLDHAASAKGAQRMRWLEHGVYLGALGQASLSSVNALYDPNTVSSDAMPEMYRAKRFDYLEQAERVYDLALDRVLAREIAPAPAHTKKGTSLELLAQYLNPALYSVAYEHRYEVGLGELWYELMAERGGHNVVKEVECWPQLAAAVKVRRFVEVVRTQLEESIGTWSTKLDPWVKVVEEARSLWPDAWGVTCIANFAAGIRAKAEQGSGGEDPLDANVSLCHRMRYARLRAGSAAWWERQFERAKSDSEIMLLTLVLMTWGSDSTIRQLADAVGDNVADISEQSWLRLHQGVSSAITIRRQWQAQSQLTISVMGLPRDPSPRFVVLLARRAAPEGVKKLYGDYLANYSGADPAVLAFAQKVAQDMLFGAETHRWRPLLKTIARAYEYGIVSERYEYQRLIRREGRGGLRIEVAQEIADQADRYPGFLVGAAELACRQDVASRVRPVAAVAQRDHWFD